MSAVLVTGPAGAGKSTVGAALARRRGAVLLDLDTVTNPVLDAVTPALDTDHWNDASLASIIRPARYRALVDVAAVQTSLGHDVVLVAPFTAETAGGPPWTALCDALGLVPGVVWLAVPTSVREQRLSRRGASRDAGGPVGEPSPPLVPHHRIDATAPAQQVVDLAVAALTRGGPP